MFAIVEDGGRQYKVEPGQEIAIDLREGVEAGAEIVFDKVLLANGGAGSVVGLPLIEGATVTGQVVDPLKKGQKLEIQKFRRRKNSRRHTGHRQKYTIVEVGGFSIPGLEIVEPEPEPEPETAPPEPVAAPEAELTETESPAVPEAETSDSTEETKTGDE